jgi:ABC-2 type transport system permease protein
VSTPAGTRPTPAPLARRVGHQAVWDLTAVLRNGEQLLVTFVLPVAVLVGVLRSGVPDLSPLPQGPAGLAGALGVAVVSSAFTGQAIALAFDRRAGVLRLLATTPLGRGGLVAARVLAVLVVVLLQSVLLVAVAALLGVRVGASALLLLPVLALGTAAMLGAGMLLAGTVRPEGVLGLANLLWVAVLVGGGLVLPVDQLPAGRTADVLGLLPTAALGDALRSVTAGSAPSPGDLLVLAAWAVLLGLAARRWLRWD